LGWVQIPGSGEVSRRLDLPAEPASPGEARAVIRLVCRAGGIGDEVREDAELVATELVANVVDHARTSCTLTVTLTGGGVLIEVRDFYPCPPPQPQPFDPNNPRGRGLLVVAAVSSRWGVTPFPDGKSVWALLSETSTRAPLHSS
jgi:anti-sigma regulatory factor (Ser/Thr protein kinase)